MSTPAKKQALEHFHRVLSASARSCHNPHGECAEAAIRAHSIPSRLVLAALCKDGHVVMPCMRITAGQPPTSPFMPVGRNNASTFTGLCAAHDGKLFRSIDTRLPDVSNPEHLFLLAYRAVLREYHVVLDNALRTQSIYQKQVELGLSPRDRPSKLGMLAVGHIANAYETHQYKERFDTAYINQDWSVAEHRVFELKNQRPTLAASSLFSLDDVPAPETPRVALSVYPSPPNVTVVIATTKADSQYALPLIERLLNEDDRRQKYLLSKLILQNCDNFVLSPGFFDGLSDDKKQAISDFYLKTVFFNAWEHEDERLLLF